MNEHNLVPVKNSDEAKERGRKGGLQSGKSRREKKFISQVYSDYLSKKHDVEIDLIKTKLTGEEIIFKTITHILENCNSASVALLKEIRESTIESQPPVNETFSNKDFVIEYTEEEMQMVAKKLGL